MKFSIKILTALLVWIKGTKYFIDPSIVVPPVCFFRTLASGKL